MKASASHGLLLGEPYATSEYPFRKSANTNDPELARTRFDELGSAHSHSRFYSLANWSGGALRAPIEKDPGILAPYEILI